MVLLQTTVKLVFVEVFVDYWLDVAEIGLHDLHDVVVVDGDCLFEIDVWGN